MKKVSLLILSLLIATPIVEASANKGIRKSAGGKRNSSKMTRSGLKTRNIEKMQNSSNDEEKSEEKQITSTTQPKEVLDTASCDSEYTRCMNKICTNDSLGKCVCYEDKITNAGSTKFIEFDGLKIKQGFETLEYAKKQCVQILDKCMDSRRTITEKYKNLVQRDCLMISKEDALKAKGLSGDLIELKNCVKEACTVRSIAGFEDFTFPEYSLCFNEAYAKFSIDAYCSKIIAKSSAPLGLKQLFLDEMALGRERSCKAMNGILSNDRKKCYVTIEYGKNKDIIKASKKVAVGEYMECSAPFFGTIQGETWEKRQNDVNNVLRLTATGFNVAGAALGIAGTNDPIGGLVSTGIDIAEAGANIGLDINDYKNGKMDASQLTSSTISNGITIGLSAVSFAKGVKEVGSAAKTAGSAVKASGEVAKTAGDVGKAADNVGKAAKAAQTLSMVSAGVGLASQVTDVAMDKAADAEQIKEEKNDIIKYAEVDRASGKGVVNQTLSEKGNCFLNKEWFGTENELIMLLWKY